MTHDKDIFRELQISKVIIVNRNHLLGKRKGTIAIESYSSSKLVSYVLFFPKHDQTLCNNPKKIDMLSNA